MATLFTWLVVNFKDFATPYFTTSITGKKGYSKMPEFYWFVEMFFCNKNSVQNINILKIRYMPFAKKII